MRTVLMLIVATLVGLSLPAEANMSCTLTDEEWLALTPEQRANWQPSRCYVVNVRVTNDRRLDRAAWRVWRERASDAN